MSQAGSESPNQLRVFTTCPPSNRGNPDDYLVRVRDIARWSEAHGCEGILVYTDHGLVDPWLVAQCIVQATGSIRPLVAVQPIYMHPYTVAKMVASFGHLYARQLHLNFVAGGFKNDLLSFGDTTPHDERYERLAEYMEIVKALLGSSSALTFEGRFYNVRNLKLTPPLRTELQPGMMVSGSSAAGRSVARTLGATAVSYPEPAGGDWAQANGSAPAGIRIGVIAREDAGEAWQIARARFPEDRKGQVAHALARSVSDSEWHRRLAEIGPGETEDDPYWLHPFQHYQTFCPYLVGSYDCVAREVGRYLAAGVTTVILDVPTASEDLDHTNVVLSEAVRLVAAEHSTP